MEKVVAVIVTYNRKKLLEECLDAVLAQTTPVNKIVLIDNASTDGTNKLFEEKGKYNLPGIDYHKMKTNLGGSGGFYEGMKLCRNQDFDWVWIMDDDTIPEQECLERLLHSKKIIGEEIGFLASCIKGPNNEAMNVPDVDMSPSENGYPFWYKYLADKCVQISSATFVSILVSSEAIRKCGLPCKDYFIWGDDAEYTKRISTHYGPCYFVGDSVAVHKRFNAKKLDILLEDDPKRLEMFQYYYRNMTINVGIFYGKKRMRKLVMHNFKLALFRFLDRDFLRAKIIVKGTIKSINEFNKFADYINSQIES